MVVFGTRIPLNIIKGEIKFVTPQIKRYGFNNSFKCSFYSLWKIILREVGFVILAFKLQETMQIIGVEK